MSWDSYIDNLKAQGCNEAAICGINGGGVWAKSVSVNVDATFISSAENIIKSGEPCGISYKGEKYICIKVDKDDNAQFKKSTSGIVVFKTNQALVFGFYGPEDQPGKVTAAVGKIADYLKSSGY
ncbi:hypothetical protein ACJMK2_019198 [Sinanodonta woodiana]|uniref:Profilin n=1 Tax=Sinanodonta woodiana TaxID=1069815 RepID=A0ABD3UG18_SINWO